MLRFPRNLPIKRKVTLVVLVTSTACLIVACVALFAFQLLSFRRSFVADLSALSDVVANSAIASVAFDDTEAAEAVLAGLKAKPHVRSASIVKEGEIFALFAEETISRSSSVTRRRWGIASMGTHCCTRSRSWSRRREGDALRAVRLRRSLLPAAQALQRDPRRRANRLRWPRARDLDAAPAHHLEPILKLAETARTIAENKDYSVRVTGSYADEVGVFTDAFNKMLSQIEAQDSELQRAQGSLENQVKALQREIAERERAEHQLADAHNQLVETSRQAGMAEVATGVLHNVGNVLNSVNVSATLVSDRVRQSKAENLLKASNLLREHAADLQDFFTRDPRAKLLLDYLPNLGEHLNEERAEMLTELELLTKNLDHIKDIVAMQQNYAKVSGVIEPVSIPGLAEDALQIHEAALTRHGVQVERRYADVPPVAADKHKILQILVNLIANAKYAMDELARPRSVS
jgi:signal transduction histidine kinase